MVRGHLRPDGSARRTPLYGRGSGRARRGARGNNLEIGAGTGLNFPHYRDDVEVIAIEPDPYMRQRAQRRLAESGRHIALHDASAEELPFEDDSFDTVVGTLVMCSVPRPQRALAEIRRVLSRVANTASTSMSAMKVPSVPFGRMPYCPPGAGSPRAAIQTETQFRP